MTSTPLKPVYVINSDVLGLNKHIFLTIFDQFSKYDYSCPFKFTETIIFRFIIHKRK